MTERQKFVKLALKARVTITRACEQFMISQQTGCKILARHEDLVMAGLANASRAPKTHLNQSLPEVEAAALRVRKAHPTWGSKKILGKRAGVVEPRGRRRRRQPTAPPVVEAAPPDDVWSIAYKRWFRVGDGTRCDPLTVNDVSCRASIVCQAMVSPKTADVW